MDDLISRQAAIDAVEKNACNTQRIMDAVNNLPPAQPEPTDINAKEAVYNLAEKIGIHQLFALTVELRGEPIQPEPQWIPVERELPEDFTDVLVWFEYFRYGDYNCLYQTHGIGTYVANYNLWTVNHETGWKDLRVIAWMPLPTPYNKIKGERT